MVLLIVMLLLYLQLTCSLMDKLVTKLQSDEKNKHPLMDLAIAMIPYLDQEHLQKSYVLVQPLLQVSLRNRSGKFTNSFWNLNHNL